MSVGHTMGPWELCDRGDYGDFDGQSRVILGDDGTGLPMRLAVVQVHDGDRLGEGEANARLIAAAPELLEALEAALLVHGDGYSWGPQARSAIAKATGAA